MRTEDRETVLREAEAWALARYAPALARAGQLTASERNAVAAELARRIGLRADQIDPQTLALTPRAYASALLPDRRLDTFDMRLLAGAEGRSDARDGVIDRYLREELAYRTDLAYAGLGEAAEQTRSINARWNYNSGEITPEVMAAAMAGEGPPGAQPWALNAMRLNPEFKVMVAAGLYDSLNSCLANRELQNKLEPSFARNFTMQCYRGGHMMYRDAPEHRRLSADIGDFIAGRSEEAGSRQ
jgi:hypothetical protein